MKKYKLIFFLFSIIYYTAYATVQLPVLFQSNMVLQRDKNCAVWGTADPKEKITLHVKDRSYKTVADKNGNWKIIIPAQPAGGPFQIIISGINTLTLDNILFGDVWVCGGQSNMQFHVSELAQKEADSLRDNNPNIRIFTAGLGLNYVPQDTLQVVPGKLLLLRAFKIFLLWHFSLAAICRRN